MNIKRILTENKIFCFFYKLIFCVIKKVKEKIYFSQINSINKNWVAENGNVLQEIEIETLNRCNGICPFCPVNVNEPQRPYQKMTKELFEKIIDDLASMNFKGNISLFSNNEPFLDERIIDFHTYAYNKLPEAKHCLFTNGTMLTLEKFKSIIPYLDYLHIDNYNDNKEINEKLKPVYEYIQDHEELKEKVNFVFRLQNEVLSSRGGQAPNKKNIKLSGSVNTLCLLPWRMIVVRPDGKVSLCCNDALGKYTLGDLNTSTISEVWNSDIYNNIRKKMLCGRKNLNLCNLCDTETHPGKYGKQTK